MKDESVAYKVLIWYIIWRVFTISPTVCAHTQCSNSRGACMYESGLSIENSVADTGSVSYVNKRSLVSFRLCFIYKILLYIKRHYFSTFLLNRLWVIPTWKYRRFIKKLKQQWRIRISKSKFKWLWKRIFQHRKTCQIVLSKPGRRQFQSW